MNKLETKQIETKQIETPIEQDWGSRDHVQTLVLMMLATVLGVYVHGAAADALVKKGIGPIRLTASEVVLEARNVLNVLNST